MGDGMPFSDLVGLVLRTVTASPERILPPTNSLPPLRCEAGLIGIDLGESGTGGDCGGTRKGLSREGGNAAPGLNENDGRAGDLGMLPSTSVVEIIKADSCASIAERGRLPVALEKDEGAEEEDGLAGNTKCGFGGGRAVRGDAWGASEGRLCNAASTRVGSAYLRVVASSGLFAGGAPSIMSGPNVVAIFPTRAAAPEEMDNSIANG
jgi:hypothetical protein